MQAIARVNRVFRATPGSLVADFLRMTRELKGKKKDLEKAFLVTSNAGPHC